VGHVALRLEIRVEFWSKIIKVNRNIWVYIIELNLTLRSTFCRLFATSVSIHSCSLHCLSLHVSTQLAVSAETCTDIK
jgi:hypothetical protein